MDYFDPLRGWLRLFLCMRAETAGDESRFLEARRAYDAAFREFAREVRFLQSLASKADSDPKEIAKARCLVELAQRAYRESRDRLVELVMPGMRPIDERDSDRRAAVERLAYQLWENAGRPTGRAEEHWYRAERLQSGEEELWRR